MGQGVFVVWRGGVECRVEEMAEPAIVSFHRWERCLLEEEAAFLWGTRCPLCHFLFFQVGRVP